MRHAVSTSNQIQKLLAIIILGVAQSRAEEGAQAPKRIVVSIADRKLVLVHGERVVKVYDVAVGRRTTPSPSGEFTIESRVANPTWYGPKQVVGPGEANPLGTRWLGLSAKGYGIHGTNVPNSIGKAASHGCIRMRNADVEELFELVQTGVKVQLLDESLPLMAAGTNPDQPAAGGE